MAPGPLLPRLSTHYSPCPALNPKAQPRASPSPLLLAHSVRAANFPQVSAGAGQSGPPPTPGRQRLGLLPAAPLALLSSHLQRVLHRTPARAPPGGCSSSRSLPSRYPGNRLLLPPASQPVRFTWRLAANGQPHHLGPLSGSEVFPRLESGRGVSSELLLPD